MRTTPPASSGKVPKSKPVGAAMWLLPAKTYKLANIVEAPISSSPSIGSKMPYPSVSATIRPLTAATLGELLLAVSEVSSESALRLLVVAAWR